MEPALAWAEAEGALIRPGVQIGEWLPADTPRGGCTGAFVFEGAGRAYLSTAAHCVGGEERVSIANDAAHGTRVYCSFEIGGGPCETSPSSGDRNDFALLQLDEPDVARASPEVLGVGGPAGVAPCAELRAGDPVVAYGNSSYKPEGAPLRKMEGELLSYDGSFALLVRFQTPGIPADSGSPVLAGDGRALGVLRALNPDGTNSVTCLEAALVAMAENGGPAVRLAKP